MLFRSGNGSPGHLSGELFKQMAGVNIAHVPYKGGAQAMTDMMSGQVHLIFESMSSISPHHRGGRLRGIAVTGPKRLSSFPDLPTIAETLPGFEFVSWMGSFVPAGTPMPIVEKLNAELKKAVADPGVIANFSAQSLDIMHSTPAEFAKLIRDEYVKYESIVKISGARLD